MSIKVTRTTRVNSRLVTWQIDNTTEGTSIQMSDSDFKDLLKQGTKAIEKEES